MAKVTARLDEWLWYSVRRAGLDRDLQDAADCMQGRVLEIGGGCVGRRGRFRPPVDRCESWVYLDRSSTRRPDVQADVQQLPYAVGSFDTVVCLEVLEYVEHPVRALQEIVRVLRPQGHLILATPFLHRADATGDYWRFTEHGLRLLLEQAGLEILWLRSQGYALGVATNILKYAVCIQRPGWRRTCVGFAVRPLLSLLWMLDQRSADRHPELATFSTGYLVVARPQVQRPDGGESDQHPRHEALCPSGMNS